LGETESGSSPYIVVKLASITHEMKAIASENPTNTRIIKELPLSPRDGVEKNKAALKLYNPSVLRQCDRLFFETHHESANNHKS